MVAIAEGRDPASGLPVAEAVRLAQARNACPDGTRPEDCACADEMLCRRNDGARMSRADCYRCLAETPHDDRPGDRP